MTQKKPTVTNQSLTERLLDAKAVSFMTSIGRSTLLTMTKDGAFPPPLKISKNRIAWLESEVLSWIASRERVTWAA